MSALFTTISRELREDAANISEIICSDKYKLLWTNDITDDMLTHIAYYMKLIAENEKKIIYMNSLRNAWIMACII